MAKTTIDISDALLREAKELAASEGITLLELIEQGLRKVLADRKLRHQPFRLRKASFRGKGLNPNLADAGWDRISELSYDGRDER